MGTRGARGAAGSPAGSPVGSVDKALTLLEILGRAGPEGLMLREIAAESGLNKGSVHRLLRALAYRGYAQQGALDQRYRLGPAPLDLTESFTRGENLPVLFAPALAGISLRTQELVHLGRLEGTDVVYLDKVEPERTLRVWSRVGSRAPAARTSLGRALLAADGVSDPQLVPYAEATGEGEDAIAPVRLQEIIDATRQRGWSVEHEEYFRLIQFAATDDRFTTGLRKGERVAIKDVATHLNAAMEAGEIPDSDPQLLANAMLGAHTRLVQLIHRGEMEPTAEVFDKAVAFSLYGILGPGRRS